MFELRGGADKPLPGEIGEVVVNGIEWVFQPCANLADGRAKDAGRQVELVAQEFVRVLRIDVERRESGFRKVLQVLRHYDIAAPDDRRREDVAIVHVG
ncbi:hypothetical protein Ms3S1_41770 [Methylosinus sp. 3S-1]